MLKRLHVRGLIAKVPRSRRWHVSEKGHRVLGAVVQLYHHGIPAAIAYRGVIRRKDAHGAGILRRKILMTSPIFCGSPRSL